MPTVLLTGFEPFGGEDVNPSWQAVEALAAEGIPGAAVEAVALPVEFGASVDVLRAAVERYDPGLVVCTGQAGGRTELSVERIAVNVDDAPMPDNAGRRPVDEPVAADGPAAYFARLPVKACAAAALDAGVPARVSQTAGTFVCNHVFYGLMHLAATERPGLRGGFVHVPYSAAQAAAKGGGVPSLSIADMARGLSAAASAALQPDPDAPPAATVRGSLH